MEIVLTHFNISNSMTTRKNNLVITLIFLRALAWTFSLCIDDLQISDSNSLISKISRSLNILQQQEFKSDLYLVKFLTEVMNLFYFSWPCPRIVFLKHREKEIAAHLCRLELDAWINIKLKNDYFERGIFVFTR